MKIIDSEPSLWYSNPINVIAWLFSYLLLKATNYGKERIHSPICRHNAAEPHKYSKIKEKPNMINILFVCHGKVLTE